MKRSRVRGPNSALTEFLRVEGITDAFRSRQREQERTGESGENGENGGTETVEIDEIDENEVNEVNDVNRVNRVNSEPHDGPKSARALRTALRNHRDRFRRATAAPKEEAEPAETLDLEDSDAPLRLSDSDAESGQNPAGVGQEEDCVDCGNPFTATVYSRFVDALQGYICEDCNETLRKRERTARQNQANARKRRKKLAKALLDKKAVRIASLQDACIRAISGNIQQVDVLGDIGQHNLNRISRILSKNRSLDDATAALFLRPDATAVEFWDCSNVSSDTFTKIAAYCANLESLTLHMCGQFHNDNLAYYKEKLPRLRRLALNGPFLINDRVWQDFFDHAACDLQEFEVRNTHRFSGPSLISLLESRGRNLTSLALSRLDGLDSAAVYELIPEYIAAGKMESLELSHPHKADLVSDDLLVHILAITGESLRHLNVDGCTGLTDAFLAEGVAKFCPRLESLSMRNLHLVTDEGFAEAWREFAAINYGGLVNVDCTKNTGLGDRAVHALLSHSANTLVELSLNSVDRLTKGFWVQTLGGDAEQRGETVYGKVALPSLTKLDVGFVRSFDDEVAETLTRECGKLAILEVFGNNRFTNKARVRPDVLVIGRQGEYF